MHGNSHNRQNYQKPVGRGSELIADPIKGQTASAEAVTEPESEKSDVIAAVTNCLKLNVRKEAKSDAEIITVIPASSEVVVDLDASTSEFYKVRTSAGIEGFCMRKFIAIRK